MTRLLIIAAAIAIAGCGESYTDPFGNTISKEEHERRVAADAAHDALVNLMIECKAHPRPECPVSKGN